MKKAMTIVMVFILVASILVGCGCQANPSVPEVPTVENTTPVEDTTPSTTDPVEGTTPTEGNENENSEPTEGTNPTEGTQPDEDATNPTEGTEPSDKPTDPTDPTEGTEPTQPKDYTLKLNKSSLALKVGQVGTLSWEYTGSGKLTWSSSNNSVATVSNGKITAKSEGTATITLSDGQKSATCVVTVTKDKTTDYTLKVASPAMTLEVGKTGTISYEYTGTGTLTWTSSNTSVATVTNGKVTAHAKGTATITLSDGVKTSQCVVTVNPKPEPEATLTLDKTSATMEVGKSITLKATYTGNKSLSWSSSNSAIASVSNGKVTAHKSGDVVITVSDGTKNAQCVIHIDNPPAPVEAKLNLTKSTLTLDVGATSTLSYEYTGSGKLSWSSSDTSIATVSNGKVTAKSAGTVTITLSDGKLSDTCKVTVNAPAPTEPPAPSVGELTIKTATDTVVYVGSTLQIDYTYTGDKSALTFKSDDTSVLTVNNSGVVTGVGEGQTRVRVYHGDTQVGRVRLVVEKKPVEESKPEAKSIYASSFTGPYFNGTSGVVGNYMTFTANASTTDDSVKQVVTATSSNSGVATVTMVSEGNSCKRTFKVSFVGSGSATITITSEDGKASTSYTVNVKGGYSSAMGGQLTPEQFASCVNGIISENGVNVSTSVGYRVLTLTTDELTGSRARSLAESWVREHWPNGVRSMGMSYQGVNEDGNHVFYFHR